jgi:D-alanyl-lipoteichoic acid acyltransferase DltB (MBOAT superfamily)
MQFNSFTFLNFLVVFLILYYLTMRWWKVQNLLLLTASYAFYSLGGGRWVLLLLVPTLVDYWIGRLLGGLDDRLNRTDWLRKLLLAASILVNLALLGIFKYFNFFTENLQAALNAFHLSLDVPTLSLIVPLGISFWTLKSMSYTIDVYQKRQEPVRSLVNYALFLAFFPTLLAGPLDRARKFLPQVAAPRSLTVEKLKIGLHLILVGYFKKLVIADNLAARIVNPVYNNSPEYYGLDILIAGLAFTFQLYGDFSGYTDIARGAALLLGFDTALNFRWPYFSFNPTDFWQRWHISFSEWLRDYVFFPVRRLMLRWKTAPAFLGLVVPPLVTMSLSGLWHGAQWTFVIWGVYHAFLIILYRLLEKKPIHQDPWKSGQAYPWVVFRLVLMFFFTMVGWMIFRSSSLSQAGYLLGNLSLVPSANSQELLYDLLFYTVPWCIVEVIAYARQDLFLFTRLPFPGRLLFNGALLAGIVLLNTRQAAEFIYVQF